jgi:hypothetical protein
MAETRRLEETGIAVKKADGLWHTKNHCDEDGLEIPVITLKAEYFDVGTEIKIFERLPRGEKSR